MPREVVWPETNQLTRFQHLRAGHVGPHEAQALESKKQVQKQPRSKHFGVLWKCRVDVLQEIFQGSLAKLKG